GSISPLLVARLALRTRRSAAAPRRAGVRRIVLVHVAVARARAAVVPVARSSRGQAVPVVAGAVSDRAGVDERNPERVARLHRRGGLLPGGGGWRSGRARDAAPRA